jgi:hypothetical protein
MPQLYRDRGVVGAEVGIGVLGAVSYAHAARAKRLTSPYKSTELFFFGPATHQSRLVCIGPFYHSLNNDLSAEQCACAAILVCRAVP